MADDPEQGATLGPVLETYRGSRLALGVVSLSGLISLAALYRSLPALSSGPVGTLALAVLIAVAVLRNRVTLHNEGLRARSLLGTQEILWQDVELFYFSASRFIAKIPVYSGYRLRLYGRDGKEIRIDNGVERSWVLGEWVAERTTPLLLPDALRRFETGAEVSFGPIKVRKRHGLRLSRTLDPLLIPWAELADYQIRRGFLFLRGTGKLTRKVRVGTIPNVFVLVALLDHVRSLPPEFTTLAADSFH